MKIRGKHISMFCGDSESITLRVRDKTGKGKRLKSGDTIRMTVRAGDCGRVAFQKVITEFQDGTALIDIAPDDTSHLHPGDYSYSVRWLTAEGASITIIAPNTFTILPGGDEDYERTGCCHRI